MNHLDHLTSISDPELIRLVKNFSATQYKVFMYRINAYYQAGVDIENTDFLYEQYNIVRKCLLPTNVRATMMMSTKHFKNLPPFVNQSQIDHLGELPNEDLILLREKFEQALSIEQIAVLRGVDGMFMWADFVKMLDDYSVQDITLPMIQGKYEITGMVMGSF